MIIPDRNVYFFYNSCMNSNSMRVVEAAAPVFAGPCAIPNWVNYCNATWSGSVARLR